MRNLVWSVVLSPTLLAAAGAASPAAAQAWEAPGILRFGAFLQGGFTNLDVQDNAGLVRRTLDLDGAGIGVSFGYDWRIGNLMLGVEADAATSNDNGRTGIHTFATDYFVTFRGRLGGFARPDLLIYATAGLALAGVEYKPIRGGGAAVDPDTGAVVTGSTLKSDQTLAGLVVGGGIEYDLHGILLFGEYLYAGFEGWTFSAPGPRRLSTDLDTHMFRIGVKFKIGDDFRYDRVGYGH